MQLFRPLLLALLLGAGTAVAETPASEYAAPFDGRRFANLVPTPTKSLWDLIKWRLNREIAGDWRDVEIPEWSSPRPQRVEGSELLVTFVNHATVLLQTSGINVLTDPIWSQRCSPISFIGPRRRHAPGMEFDQLPPIDAVVISHNHYDHMDIPSLRRLQEAHQPLFVAGLGSADFLRAKGLERVVELDWWQAIPVSDGVQIHAVPAQHWSARTRLDTNEMLWAGYVLDAPGGAIFFAGDTGMGPHFTEIRRRYGAPRLSLLPVGAYLPRWFMKDNHLSPADALEVHDILDSGHSMAIHFGTFELGDDGQYTAVRELARLREQAGIAPDQFWVPQPGIPRALQ